MFTSKVLPIYMTLIIKSKWTSLKQTLSMNGMFGKHFFIWGIYWLIPAFQEIYKKIFHDEQGHRATCQLIHRA